MKIQKKSVKSTCFNDKFADLLNFATALCFDFHFFEGQGKKFRIITEITWRYTLQTYTPKWPSQLKTPDL